MIPVAHALKEIFSLLKPLTTESITIQQGLGRVLAETAIATREQPPFASSAMDGYAVRTQDVQPGARLGVIGESAAGHRFTGQIGPNEAVRIFTGAPVPTGADRVIIQEDVLRDGDTVTLGTDLDAGPHIRAAGGDFKSGDTLDAPRVLSASDLALLAAMNIPQIHVTRKPVVALIATGDELVMPGATPGPDQIIASNSFGLMALANSAGAEARMLPIARDNHASLEAAFELATGADLIVTIGGASVGDHDLVGQVAQNLGLQRAFYKIAMRPGKPLMAGKLGNSTLLGLPGNPVSSMVCGHVFMAPAIRLMLGLGGHPAPRQTATLSCSLSANGSREHYMRASHSGGSIEVFKRQDSALLSVLSGANALLIRPANDPARSAGDNVSYIPI